MRVSDLGWLQRELSKLGCTHVTVAGVSVDVSAGAGEQVTRAVERLLADLALANRDCSACDEHLDHRSAVCQRCQLEDEDDVR